MSTVFSGRRQFPAAVFRPPWSARYKLQKLLCCKRFCLDGCGPLPMMTCHVQSLKLEKWNSFGVFPFRLVKDRFGEALRNTRFLNSPFLVPFWDMFRSHKARYESPSILNLKSAIGIQQSRECRWQSKGSTRHPPAMLASLKYVSWSKRLRQ